MGNRPGEPYDPTFFSKRKDFTVYVGKVQDGRSDDGGLQTWV